MDLGTRPRPTRKRLPGHDARRALLSLFTSVIATLWLGSALSLQQPMQPATPSAQPLGQVAEDAALTVPTETDMKWITEAAELFARLDSRAGHAPKHDDDDRTKVDREVTARGDSRPAEIRTSRAPLFEGNPVRPAPAIPSATPGPEYYTVVGGDTLSAIADALGLDSRNLTLANGLTDSDVLSVGQRLVVPAGKGEASADSKPARAASLRPQFVWPASGPISTYFDEPGAVWVGGRHSGLDVAAPEGDQIRASEAGTVLEAGWAVGRGYGNYVVIEHGMAYRTIYGHMSRIVATKGQRVSRGDLIGYVGDTGVSFGPHLHFEVLLGGAAIDPLTLLP